MSYILSAVHCSSTGLSYIFLYFTCQLILEWCLYYQTAHFKEIKPKNREKNGSNVMNLSIGGYVCLRPLDHIILSIILGQIPRDDSFFRFRNKGFNKTFSKSLIFFKIILYILSEITQKLEIWIRALRWVVKRLFPSLFLSNILKNNSCFVAISKNVCVAACQHNSFA